MKDVKALILCNNPIALPGIREFAFFGKAGAIVTTRRNKEMQHILGQMLKDTGIPLLTFNRKEFDAGMKKAIAEYGITVGLIMTFPYIISEEILALPPSGFINTHYGLLPRRRGPQPIIRHLLSGDTEAGVTLHKVDAGIDTGPIIMQEKIAIDPTDTYGTLQGKLAQLSAKPLANLLKILSYGSIIPASPQDESLAEYHEMPGAEELTINWKEMTAEAINRLVNACNPWNKGAGASINQWLIGITEVEILPGEADEKQEPGTILACSPEEGLLVITKDLKKLKINIAYTQEGFFSGYKLAGFGVQAGQQFS